MNGVVVRITRDRGYCFIRGEDGISRFAHIHGFLNPNEFDWIEEGHKVKFTSVHQEPPVRGNGLRAIEIEVVR